jgi:hypothetical protein
MKGFALTAYAALLLPLTQVCSLLTVTLQSQYQNWCLGMDSNHRPFPY